MKVLQQRVREFVTQNQLQADVAHRLLDLVAEVGELSKEVLKGSRYGAEPFVRPADWEEELGDVIFSVLCLANDTGVDIEEALTKALGKYQRRISAKGNPSSGAA